MTDKHLIGCSHACLLWRNDWGYRYGAYPAIEEHTEDCPGFHKKESLLPVISRKAIEGELLDNGKRPKDVDTILPGHKVTFDLNTINGLVHIEATVLTVTKL